MEIGVSLTNWKYGKSYALYPLFVGWDFDGNLSDFTNLLALETWNLGSRNRIPIWTLSPGDELERKFIRLQTAYIIDYYQLHTILNLQHPYLRPHLRSDALLPSLDAAEAHLRHWMHYLSPVTGRLLVTCPLGDMEEPELAGVKLVVGRDTRIAGLELYVRARVGRGGGWVPGSCGPGRP